MSSILKHYLHEKLPITKLFTRLFLVVCLAGQSGRGGAIAHNHVTGQDVLQQLNATIAWYDHVNSVDQDTSYPQNALLEDNVRQTARKAVQAAFAFARAQALFLHSQKNEGTSTPVNQPGGLAQAQQTANQRVQNLQTEIDTADQNIDKARGKARQTLISQRDVLVSDLSLAKEIQKALQGMASFANGSDVAGGLSGQINLLANSDSVPAALNGTQAPPVTQKAANTPIFRAENAGILQLIARAVSTVHARNQIDALRDHTTKLQNQVDELRSPLRA
ncbi:MAG: hypothetical protein JO270_18365, partial [Acidobacteriaceae bacterium]|nr:hypothetical protein [Acidobacteriaceae bacterium]